MILYIDIHNHLIMNELNLIFKIISSDNIQQA